MKDETWETDVCKENWKIPTDGSLRGNTSKRNGKGWYVIGFIWDENTQYFGFIKEKELWTKVLNGKQSKLEVNLNAGTEGKGLFASTFTSLLDTPVGDVNCLHVDTSSLLSSRGACLDWISWIDVISMPLGYTNKTVNSYKN